MIWQVVASVVAGAVSFVAAAVCAYVLFGGLFLVVYLLSRAHLFSAWVRTPLVLFATGFVVCALLCVLFGTAVRLSGWLRIPRWSGVATAGVAGGAGLHWFLLFLTNLNAFLYGVAFPYWWMDSEIHFG